MPAWSWCSSMAEALMADEAMSGELGAGSAASLELGYKNNNLLDSISSLVQSAIDLPPPSILLYPLLS